MNTTTETKGITKATFTGYARGFKNIGIDTEVMLLTAEEWEKMGSERWGWNSQILDDGSILAIKSTTSKEPGDEVAYSERADKAAVYALRHLRTTLFDALEDDPAIQSVEMNAEGNGQARFLVLMKDCKEVDERFSSDGYWLRVSVLEYQPR